MTLSQWGGQVSAHRGSWQVPSGGWRADDDSWHARLDEGQITCAAKRAG